MKNLSPMQYAFLAVLAIAACAGMDRFIYDYRIGFENHGIQIPYIYKLQNPDLYPGDRFMETMDGYFSYFWLMMAWITERAPLTTVFAIGHGIVLVARYAGLFMLTRAAFPALRSAPFLAMWFGLWGETVLGAESFHWYYFTHTPVATVLGIWALYFAVRGLWWPAFALAGFIFNIHAMQSSYVLLMLGAALVVQKENWKPTRLASMVAWPIAASPGLYWMFTAGAVGSPENLEALIRAFYPYHFFPSSFSDWNWAGLVFMLLLIGAAGWPQRRDVRAIALLAMAAAILVMWIVGGVLLETIAPGILIKMHLYRASSYLLIVAVVLVAGAIVGVILPVVSRGWRPIIVIAAMMLAASLGSFNFLRYQQPFILTLLIASALCTSVALVPMKKKLRRIEFAWYALAFFALVPVLQTKERFRNMHDYFWWLQRFVEVQQWARENTEPDDLILVPPNMNAFRTFSQRPIVFEWFDGAAMMWDKDYAAYWEKWYLESGGKFRKRFKDPIFVRIGEKWLEKPAEEIEAIARREGASYIVGRPAYYYEQTVGHGNAWQEQRLYDNGFFFILKTPEAVTPTSEQ